MEFKVLFSILKTHLSDGKDIPYFVREFMDMITDLPEEEWIATKSPSKKVKDETLKNYAKRGLSKTLAGNIVYRFTLTPLIERVNERPYAAKKSLASDLEVYDSAITVQNVAKHVSELVMETIRIPAGLKEQTELEKQKLQQTSIQLKKSIWGISS